MIELSDLIKDKRVVTRESIIKSVTLAGEYCGLSISRMFIDAGSTPVTWSRFKKNGGMSFKVYEKVIRYAYENPRKSSIID